MNADGTVLLEMTSGEWKLIIEPNGTLNLACSIPNFETGFSDNFIVELGECCFKSPMDAIEAINMIRSSGQSVSAPN